MFATESKPQSVGRGGNSSDKCF